MKKLFIAILLSFSILYVFADTVTMGLDERYDVYLPVELHNNEKSEYKAKIVEVAPVSDTLVKAVYRIYPNFGSKYDITWYYEKGKTYRVVKGGSITEIYATFKLLSVTPNILLFDRTDIKATVRKSLLD